MNFLAHIHLSSGNDNLKLGNFIADAVRNKDLASFNAVIQMGIQLHWAIDEFTDHHEIVKESKALLYDEHHKYSAVLVDIYYDHFLAKNWHNYSNENLRAFVNHFYDLLKSRKEELPERINFMRPYMIRYDWLFNYQYLDGIDRVLGGMSRRASFNNKMNKGVVALKDNYEAFEKHFSAFYPELEIFVKNKTQELGFE